MEFVRLLLLFLHFVGLAVLIGGFLAQLPAAREGGRSRPATAMLHGALTQLITGVALVGVNQALDEEVDNAKISVKLVVLLVVLALILVGRRRPIGTPVFMSIGALAVVNVGVAVFWT